MSALAEIRRTVSDLHQELVRNRLVAWTSGNISARVPGEELVVIKPSGLSFDELTPESMVVVDLDANVVEGEYAPSSDTATHCVIYREMPDVGGVVHTHSAYATAWAARGEEIPCVLTAMADEFGGPIPIGPFALIGDEEIGRGVVETLTGHRSPAVLMHSHGVFTIGDSRALRDQGRGDVRGRRAYGAPRARTRRPRPAEAGRHRRPLRALPERLRPALTSDGQAGHQRDRLRDPRSSTSSWCSASASPPSATSRRASTTSSPAARCRRGSPASRSSPPTSARSSCWGRRRTARSTASRRVHFYWIGAIPAMVFLGIVMMPFYYGSKVRSVPEYLRRRFGKGAHLFNAIAFAFATILIAGVNLYALALVLQLLLGWPILLGIVVAAGIVLVYITLGGLSSAIYNEVLQFFLIVVAVVPVTYIGLKSLGGYDGLTDAISQEQARRGGDALLEGPRVSDTTNPIGANWIAIVFGLGFVQSFGYWTTNFAEVQRALIGLEPVRRAADAADRRLPEAARAGHHDHPGHDRGGRDPGPRRRARRCSTTTRSRC